MVIIGVRQAVDSVSSSLSEQGAPTAPPVDVKRINRRKTARYTFRGDSIPVRSPHGECEIRLKDISRAGACGMICEPLRVGDFIIIEFDNRHQIEAEIRWVRRFMVGISFSHPLTRDYLERLRERY
jgi:hypothetical protein